MNRSHAFGVAASLLVSIIIAGCSIAAGSARSVADMAAERVADEIVGYCELSPEARQYARTKITAALPREHEVRVECPDGGVLELPEPT